MGVTMQKQKQNSENQTRILIVDDHPIVRQGLIQMIDREADLTVCGEAEDAHQAFDKIKILKPDFMIVDITLKDINGIELIKQIRGRKARGSPLDRIPILVLSMHDELIYAERVLRAGARGYLMKQEAPEMIVAAIREVLGGEIYLSDEMSGFQTQSLICVPMKDSEGKLLGVLEAMNRSDGSPYTDRDIEFFLAFADKAATAMENAQLHQHLKDVYLETIHRLAVAAELRDDDTGAHIERIGRYSARLGKQIGLSHEEVERMRYASPMHDVGKIGILDQILFKPGKLTETEFEMMKSHTTIGGRILANSQSELLQLAEVIAQTHHEKWDGSGYPRGLSGEEIPLSGRIVAVADVYDALTSKRVYKPAFPVEKALETLKEEKGRHFDPDIIDAFFDCFEEIHAV